MRQERKQRLRRGVTKQRERKVGDFLTGLRAECRFMQNSNCGFIRF
jgi:hypothetical protein